MKKLYSTLINCDDFCNFFFLQLEHRRVAIEKVGEQYTDRAEKNSKA